MAKTFENNDSKSAYDARYEALKISFAPVVFQTARILVESGVLELLGNAPEGMGLETLVERNEHFDLYAMRVLCESALSADLVKVQSKRYQLTKTGYFLLNDPLVRANMDFNHYVNYKGLFDLERSLKEKKPRGLRNFGEWESIYPHLGELPEKSRQSWFSFDHLYSDSAFEEAIELLLETKPEKLLDIGGNTGKFAALLAKNAPETEVAIFDLPSQIAAAKTDLHSRGLLDRVRLITGDVLQNAPLPKGFDHIWMSQFLDCFDRGQIVSILRRAGDALDGGGRIVIMEPLWDRQRFEAAAYSIINTSPYFSAMANGYSKMFSYEELRGYIMEAGLHIESVHDGLGICQSVIKCVKI